MCPASAGLSHKTWPPDWTYAKPYMDLVVQWKRPTIVLESRSQDEEYLKARGIRELVPLANVKGQAGTSRRFGEETDYSSTEAR